MPFYPLAVKIEIFAIINNASMNKCKYNTFPSILDCKYSSCHTEWNYTSCIHCVSLDSLEKQNQWDVKGDFLWGTGSCTNGDGEVPQSASCKLKAQEGQWCDSVSLWRLGNQGADDVTNSQSEGKRRWMWCPSSSNDAEKRDTFLLTSSFCSVWSSTDWMIPSHTERGGAQSTLV